MPRLAWLITPSGESISFAIRCVISSFIALWLAFYLEMEDPYWALLNVAVLIQVMPGFLVARSVARLIGTFVAAFMAITLVATFGQYLDLFAVALTLWVAFTLFLGGLLQNNMAYGFVLSGYVCAIISIKAMSEAGPEEVFWEAVARSEETALAALVVVFVSVIVAPASASRKYFQARMGVLKAMARQIAELCRLGNHDQQPTEADENTASQLRSLLGQTLSLEQTRLYAPYDDASFSSQNRLARRLNYELLAVAGAIASLQLYIKTLKQLGQPVDGTPLKSLKEAADQLAQHPESPARKAAFRHAYLSILARERNQSARKRRYRSLPDWVVISRCLELANRLKAVVVKNDLIINRRGPQRRDPTMGREFSTTRLPLRENLKVVARATAAMGLGMALWVTHHDQIILEGTGLLLAILTTLFGLVAIENPLMVVRGFGIGTAIAAVTAFVVNFGILPRLSHYSMLMMVLSPIIFVGGLAMANPSTALVGRVSLITFNVMLMPDNEQLQSFEVLSGMFLGIELAVFLATAAYKLVLPTDLKKMLRNRVSALFGELARGSRQSREHFETRAYDHLLKLPQASDRGAVHTSIRQAAFAAIHMGVEARSIQVLVTRAQFSDNIRQEVNDILSSLEELFQTNPPALASVFRLQRRANELAHSMLDETVQFEVRTRIRHGVRAAASAELMAAAMADYGRLRQDGGHYRFRMGEAEYVT